MWLFRYLGYRLIKDDKNEKKVQEPAWLVPAYGDEWKGNVRGFLWSKTCIRVGYEGGVPTVLSAILRSIHIYNRPTDDGRAHWNQVTKLWNGITKTMTTTTFLTTEERRHHPGIYSIFPRKKVHHESSTVFSGHRESAAQDKDIHVDIIVRLNKTSRLSRVKAF